MTPLAFILWCLLGLALAIFFIWYANQKSPFAHLQTMGIGLIVAALIYIGFALVWGDIQWVLYESIGALIYSGIAIIGMRQRSAKLLAVGWAAHIFWDTAIHLWGAGNHVAPDWYAVACLSFDLLVATYLFTYKPKTALT